MSAKKPTNRKLKILQLLPAMESGGIERSVINCCRVLDKAGSFAIHIASSGGGMVRLLPKSAKHHQLPLKRKRLSNIIRCTIGLVKLVNKERFDLIHVRSRFPAWILFLARPFLKTQPKVVSTIHSTNSQQNFLKKIYNYRLVACDHLTTVSQFMVEHLRQKWQLQRAITVVYDGIDLDLFTAKTTVTEDRANLPKALTQQLGSKFIALPGRLVRIKGHKLLLEAIAKADIAHDYQILFIGRVQSDNLLAEIKAKAAELGLTDRVLFHPSINNISSIYRLASLVVVPSTRPEAFGLVTVEAMACGSLVLATGTGATLEIIEDGVNGFIADAEIDSLAKKLEHAVKIPAAKQKQITAAAIKTAKTFDFKIHQQQFVQIYRDLCLQNTTH